MSKMKLAFTPVAQLKPYFENEIWKIKVRVVRMLRFQNGVKPGDVGGIDLILLDDKGDRIQACIRGKLISKFEDDLGEGKCCILMNFKLSPNLGNYRGTPHPFKIFFTWSTHVKKNCEEIPNDSLRFNCISFDDLLSQKHDEKVFVDVIGEIVGPCDLKEITVNDVFEESNTSISASTESTSTPTKKRASTLAIEDCVPQISSKKLKGDVSLLAEEDGQLSSTKSKPKVGHVTKDDCAKPSSTKQRKAANLIPKKEKN
uniref:Replication protein A 70 kDa DNA-binding subunit B/D first OB fold domain-containing protein n=1 Tax=Brassica oleracea var. oleracea TaxID=109376 RepID=A0A0D3CEW5_BRAOL